MNWRFLAFSTVVVLVGALGVSMILKGRPKPPPVKLPAQPVAAMYSHIRGNGTPFVRSDGSIDTAVAKEQARYDFVMIDPDRRDNMNRAALRYTRTLNTAATWLAYIPAGGFYVCGDGWAGQTPPPYGCDSTQFTWQMYRLADLHRAILYDVEGNPLRVATGVAVDFAQVGFPDDLAALAVLWANEAGVYSPGGVFNDGPCDGSTSWWASHVDFVRQGFATMAEWDEAYRMGVRAYYAALRAKLGNERIVVGNCGPSGPYTANGWTGENFPYQNPASWAGWDSVLTIADTAYTAPQLNFITTPRFRWQSPDGSWNVQDFNNPEVQRQLRFVLGSAALHDHVAGVLVGSEFDGLRGFMPDQWSELYHSLGLAKGKQSVVDGVHRREFTLAWDLVNPTDKRSSKQVVGDTVVFVPPHDAAFIPKH